MSDEIAFQQAIQGDIYTLAVMGILIETTLPLDTNPIEVTKISGQAVPAAQQPLYTQPHSVAPLMSVISEG